MVLLTNPPIPTLYLDNFKLPTEGTQLKTESVTIRNMQEVDDSNPAISHAWSAQNYTQVIGSSIGSSPLVIVNGIVLKEGISGVTNYSSRSLNYGLNMAESTGDYMYYGITRLVVFFKETVKNGDNVQFIYDTKGGTDTQTFLIPDTVTTTTTETIFEDNGYYYINLDKQSVGAVLVAVNGVMLFADKDYVKTSETRIQLLGSIETYIVGDIFTLWYRTIYTLIGITTHSRPTIPIFYYKDKTTIDEIVVRLFDSNGSIVREYKITVGINTVGNINESVTLEIPTFGTYSYDVIIRRYYPILNAKTIQTDSQTDRVTFKISRDAFYSPQSPY